MKQRIELCPVGATINLTANKIVPISFAVARETLAQIANLLAFRGLAPAFSRRRHIPVPRY